MPTKPADDPHAEIVRLIAANRDDFQADQVTALFMMTAEDLVRGGVDPIRVEAAMLRCFVRIQVELRGAGATAELLRDFADRVERPALNNPQNSSRVN